MHAVNLLAAADAAVGGFFVNVVFAAALLILGKIFGVEMYLVALVAFGLRIFKNLTALKNRLLF